ncbi:M23 family metallopeptidase [Arcticibacter eurypsychrophilus]|uniref:M23 family metallopeptidase n=1 Tax=Arcticibacter eurypsychrophilus TaxID=1434752 RepID=UPI0009F5CCD8|nr:M23 family metallopeptidase [Arcticibacter eurypsychrophilus]
MPLDIKPSLSGSFGEIRSTHFHSGTDFRTNQREGYPVYAVSDGFVSRLKVQIGGFGNAVYLTHPNGYTTVYAHLQRFNSTISRVITARQYRTHSFAVDIPLLAIEIPVKKGDIIAWSGNSGGSAGPHLHFEVRDSRTEDIVNPVLLGIDIPDNIKPTISGLYMYRLNGLPFNESTVRQSFELIGNNGNYKLNKAPIINFSGDIGFGISAYDLQPAGNRNGIYSIELQLDKATIYESELNQFSFYTSGAVSSHMDYPYNKRSGRTVIKSFVEPGNPLKIYKSLVNRGVINISDDQIHELRYIVKDVKGNTSTVNFRIRYNAKSVITPSYPEGLKKFSYNQANEYATSDFIIKVPAGVLYSDLNFRYSKGPPKGYSAVHRVHTPLIPIEGSYDLWIKVDPSLPVELQSKALIVNERGRSLGGNYANGYIKTSSGSFGEFNVSVDNTAPVIRPINIKDGMSVSGIPVLRFRISDNLSGISNFSATIDGQWVLTEYDPRNGSAWHTLDKSMASGKHHLQFSVTDVKGNSKTYNAIFYK